MYISPSQTGTHSPLKSLETLLWFAYAADSANSAGQLQARSFPGRVVGEGGRASKTASPALRYQLAVGGKSALKVFVSKRLSSGLILHIEIHTPFYI